MAISDVWVGATAPEGGAEGDTLVIKAGDVATGTASSADAPIVISMG